jgi:hypothetical protein
MRTRRPAFTVPPVLALTALTFVACTDTPSVTEPTGPAPPAARQVLDAGLVCTGSLTPFSECAALIALYNATDGPNWADNSGWETDPDPCAWAGVTCWGDGSVQQITLIDQALNGSLPAALGDFPRLVSLRILRSPNLTGPIPVEIADLADMEFLSLRRNGLSGEIPADLGTLAGLEVLDLTDNELSGEIPPALAGLHGLRSLSLAENQLTGSIPPVLGGLTSLYSLGLGTNRLSGSIPAELAGLVDLSFLGLWGNALTGPIPPELGGMDLEVLRLEENRLTGAIPPELGDLVSLQDLELQGNQLSGGIPADLTRLTALTGLRLEDNDLGGQVSLAVAAWGESIMHRCAFVPGNAGLFMPDLPAYRALDADASGDICGLPFSSAEDVADGAVEDIDDLVPDPLGAGQANALVSKIDNAVAKADAGQYQAAINQLMAFLNQLDQLVADGTLAPSEADPLREQVQALIAIWTEEL